MGDDKLKALEDTFKQIEKQFEQTRYSHYDHHPHPYHYSLINLKELYWKYIKIAPTQNEKLDFLFKKLKNFLEFNS